MTLAKKTKDFPLFDGAGDECPVCGSQIVSIGFDKGICPSCAAADLAALRAKVAELESTVRELLPIAAAAFDGDLDEAHRLPVIESARATLAPRPTHQAA